MKDKIIERFNLSKIYLTTVYICMHTYLKGMPGFWRLDNIASLLYSCGVTITGKVLMSKAINHRIVDIGRICQGLLLVCKQS